MATHNTHGAAYIGGKITGGGAYHPLDKVSHATKTLGEQGRPQKQARQERVELPSRPLTVEECDLHNVPSGSIWYDGFTGGVLPHGTGMYRLVTPTIQDKDLMFVYRPV